MNKEEFQDSLCIFINDIANEFDACAYPCDNCDPNETLTYEITFYQMTDFHSCPMQIDTTILNKRGYDKYEKLLQKEVTTEKYDIFCSYDVSGYKYWQKMNESNDPTVCISIKPGFEVDDMPKLKEDLCDYINRMLLRILVLFTTSSYQLKKYTGALEYLLPSTEVAYPGI